MRLRMLAAAGVFAILSIAWAGAAHADEGPVLVDDDRKVALEFAEDGANGDATASVTVINPTAEILRIHAKSVNSASEECVTDDDTLTVDPHAQQAVKVPFSNCDEDGKKNTPFALYQVGPGGAETKLFSNLSATPPTSQTASPKWAVVAGIFGFAAVMSAIVLLLAWLGWRAPTTYPASRDFRMGLPALEASWKFSDSWAANATVVTAAFAGLFGTENVTNALFGDGTDELLAVALVSAAAAVGLVGVSPMVLQGLREWFPKEPSEDEGQPPTDALSPGLHVTPRGLCFAGFLTLTGTLGQLGSLAYGLMESSFGNKYLIVLVAGGAGALILWYAMKGTRQNLTTGATSAPEDSEPAMARLHLLSRQDDWQGGVVSSIYTAPRRSAGIL